MKGYRGDRCCTEQSILPMKPTLLLLFAAATLQTALAVTPSAPPAPDPDHPSLVIKKMIEPRMSARALDIGLTEGEVRIVVSVDSAGKLAEWLVVGYTHPYLVDTVVEAVKHWEFEAPRWRGEPVSIQREFKITFENHGTVVSMDVSHIMEALAAQRFPQQFVFRPSTLKELDRIPTPLVTAKPAYAPRVGAPAGADATVEFFIDQTGAVRMPSVVAADDPELGANAVEAVRAWKFEPPTRGGRPVLVRVQQTFHFQP